jgi:outer membrane protein OmpA-like peptidoglycan-associated protein
MMRVSIFLLAFAVVGCGALPSQDRPAIVDGEDITRMSVRKVEVPSDIAVIRPDYQIVIGGVSRTGYLDRQVTWDRPSAVAIRSSSGDLVKTHVPEAATPHKVSPPKQGETTVYLNETHFEFGSAQLTKAAKDILSRTAVEIERMAPRKLAIIGHTDNVGSQAANQKLSERRADAVFAYLRERGMKVQTVDRVGFGETAPISSNDTAAGRAKNRRAEIMATVSK